MNQYPLWRYILLVGLVLLGLVYAMPNLYGEDPAVQVIPQGGGTIPSATINAIQNVLTSQHIAPKSMEMTQQMLLVRFKNTDDQLKAQDLIQATVGSNDSVALNLAPRTPKWLLALGAHPMRLGLDLRGGIHFLLDVDVNALIKANQTGDMHDMAQSLRKDHIRYTSIQGKGGEGIFLQFMNTENLKQAISILQNQYANYFFKENTTDANSFELVATLKPEALVALQNEAVDQNLAILQQRVNELGVAEPVISRQGATQISVDLPGVQDTARAKDMIGKVATIRWQLVDIAHDALAAKQSGAVPFGSTLYDYENQPVLLKNEVILKGSAITYAASMIGDDGRPAVSVRVGGGSDSNFNRMTAENVGKPLAVVYVETKAIKQIIDGKVVTRHQQIERVINIATIQSALGNNFQITGLGSTQYAQDLALLLRSGAYSAPVDFIQERVVGPSLGQENIHMGVLSTEIGSLLVILFMACYYRLFGIFADLALVLNIVFIVAILSILGATLTLPSIAGIVLTVGMAVDANVLINERIREELRLGVSPQASIHAGYGRAFATIVDANVTTLIVAVILLALGSGSVQGFAVTLIIGLLTSMVTSIFFTRALVNLVYGHRQVKRLSIGIAIKNK